MTAPHSIEVEAEEWNLWYCSIIVVFSDAKIGKMAGLHVQSLYSSKNRSPCIMLDDVIVSIFLGVGLIVQPANSRELE